MVFNKWRCDWYREIDGVISKLKIDIENIEFNYLIVFKKEEDKINNIFIEIIEKISEFKKVLDLNDVCFFLKYKFRNEEFRRLFFKFIVYFLSLFFKEIDKKFLN